MNYTEELAETTSQVARPTAEQEEEKHHGWLATLREALVGSRQDFTQGDIRRAIILLSVPMILEMMMESLFGLVDAFWISKLGADAVAAVAAVGITESMLTLVFTVAMGLSTGVIATVARRIGEKDMEGAAVTAAQSIFIAIVVSVPISLIGIFYTPALFRMMGASETVITAGAGYGQVI